jgi:DNA-binding response OmpR family regulator
VPKELSLMLIGKKTGRHRVGDEPRQRGRGMGGMTTKILVVEDEEHVANLIHIALSIEDYQVRVAPDGPSALQIASDWAPDLVLLDVMLPGIDGFEVCRRVRQLEQGATIPIIIITAKTGIVAKTEGFEAGADDYITKPFDIAELKLRVAAQLWRMKILREEREELNRLRMRVSRLRSHWQWADYFVAALVGLVMGGGVVAVVELMLR